MASLTITIGALTGTISADNSKATNILTQYAAAIGATGTNQEKANQVVLALARHMQETAQRQRTIVAQVEATEAIQAEIGALTWG